MKRKLDMAEPGDATAQSAPPSKLGVGREEQAKPIENAEKPSTEETHPTTASEEQDLSFSELGLEPRLVQAVAKQAFEKPTLVQRKVIPLVLDGRDVVAQARTGSGKTLAFVLPVLQAILKNKATGCALTPSTAALILTPTRELADQIAKVIEQFSAFCAKDIRCTRLTDNKLPEAVQRALLQSCPDIVVSTPAKAWQVVQSGALGVGKLTHMVLDEADLVLSYGYDEDLENLARSLPKDSHIQTVMTSATISADLQTLKGLFCRNPVFLKLEEETAEREGLAQFYVKCGEDEKFLLAYVIFKLALIKGKCIIFLNDVDRCYRLKLFFQQFGIRSCILNSELPVNSRISCVEEFNRGIYDLILASDENEVLGSEDGSTPEEEEEEAGKVKPKQAKKGTSEDAADGQRAKKKRKIAQRDKEYGVSRGIDFQNVAAVINFDLPTTAKSYTHRIGRTARAGRAGMALSFVVPKELFRKHAPTTIDTAENDEKILRRIVKQQANKGLEVKNYAFDMKQVNAFRYRMNDALRAVTRTAIRKLRVRELRQELLRSEKLKRHFEENPAELAGLRHDSELRGVRQNVHLKHVPDYLLPAEGRKALTRDVGFVPLRKEGKKVRGHRKGGIREKGGGGRKRDPLKTFKARRRTK